MRPIVSPLSSHRRFSSEKGLSLTFEDLDLDLSDLAIWALHIGGYFGGLFGDFIGGLIPEICLSKLALSQGTYAFKGLISRANVGGYFGGFIGGFRCCDLALSF
jgi:hypothetical protein